MPTHVICAKAALSVYQPHQLKSTNMRDWDILCLTCWAASEQRTSFLLYVIPVDDRVYKNAGENSWIISRLLIPSQIPQGSVVISLWVPWKNHKWPLGSIHLGHDSFGVFILRTLSLNTWMKESTRKQRN